MRPTPVRSSHTNRSASRRRPGFVSAPVNSKPAPQVNLVARNAQKIQQENKVTEAA
jgi:hypothetical protein